MWDSYQWYLLGKSGGAILHVSYARGGDEWFRVSSLCRERTCASLWPYPDVPCVDCAHTSLISVDEATILMNGGALT